jgi:hypothetical protein|tara:strand:- start:975 stop:1355 length:381 start_codon:yes stop_codon:yes gene_type:complete
MKNLIAITLILSALTFTSCQDCKDCQSTSTLNLSIEYFELDTNGVYQVSTTDTFTYSGTGSISNSSLPSDTSGINLANAISPILTQELCGEELKEYNNSAVTFEQINGDTLLGLFKYTWTENWDCQ